MLKHVAAHDLNNSIDTISSHVDLAIFIQNLRQNLINCPNDWQNMNLVDFLDALASWTEDIDGYYENTGQKERLDQLDWKTFAEMLMAARIYE